MLKRLASFTAMVAIVAADFGFSSPALAQSPDAIEAARRVNIAGRQRMLSQRMSKASCFISIGLDADNQQTALQGAFDQFGTAHEALRYGNEEMGLGTEHNARLHKSLELVGSNWASYSPLISEALASGTVSLPAITRIDELGLVLLANMNSMVNQTANIYGNALPEMPLLLSLTIDLAGRQRMFSQKAGKEFCLIDAGIDVAANQEKLAQTTTLFTLTLQALIDGMAGMVMAAPNDEIRAKLVAVSDAWQGPKATFESAASGGAITDAERAIAVQDLEQVLVLMNEAVGMYEQAIPE